MISAFCLGRGEGAGRKERGREIPHIRRATLSQERKRGKKSACSVRNDSPGGGERQCIAEGRSNAAPPQGKTSTGGGLHDEPKRARSRPGRDKLYRAATWTREGGRRTCERRRRAGPCARWRGR